MATTTLSPAGATTTSPAPPPVFTTFDLPYQRQLTAPHAPGTVIPLARRPTAHCSLDDAVATVHTLQQTHTLTKLLSTHRPVLFRGIPVHSAADISRFAHAFGYQQHEIIGIVVERGLLAPNVAPANESPPQVTIYNHNESPQVPHVPGYIFFYGHREPETGGDTPIASSLELFRRAQDEIPELVADLAAKGVLSTVRYKPEAQYAGGSTLAQAFGKEWTAGDSDEVKRVKAEAQLRRYGRGEHTTWEWDDAGGGLTVRHLIPAIRRQAGTNLPVLFTGLASTYVRSLAGEDTSKVTTVTYGDGTPIPMQHLAKLKAITDEIRVLHKWQAGDVLVFDNVIAQHGRQPWEGDRVVLAILFDGRLPGAYGNAAWEQLVGVS